jgi:hypothetical protein
MAWEAPNGYALCPECSCDRPVRNGQAADHHTIWQCKPSDGCKAEGCGCYLCVIAPGEKHLRIDAKPGTAGASRELPPGWAYVCACMKEVGEAKDRESGWSQREDVGWLAPKGYKFKAPCTCQLPRSEAGKSDYWLCGSKGKEPGDVETDCFLVGVPPDEKQLQILSHPGHVFAKADVPPGWSIFCICLEKI